VSTPWIAAGSLQRNLTEAQWEQQIRSMAALLGWTRVYHTYDARGSDKGYPDLTLVSPRFGVLWLETKGRTGRPSLKQIDWIEELQTAGEHAYIVKPEDYDTVQHILRGNVDRPRQGAMGLLTIEAYDPKVWDLLKYQDRSGAK